MFSVWNLGFFIRIDNNTIKNNIETLPHKVLNFVPKIGQNSDLHSFSSNPNLSINQKKQTKSILLI